jgi:MinD-like ATPase involved in chromosome partitioning or flagellar assembly
LVTTSDLAAVKATRTTIDVLERLGVARHRWSVVCNTVSGVRDPEHRQLARHLGVDVVAVVPADPAVARSMRRGTPVLCDEPLSTASVAIVELAGVLAGDTPLSASAPVSTSGPTGLTAVAQRWSRRAWAMWRPGVV